MNTFRIPVPISIFLVAFFLNLVWEKLQMPLYSVHASGWECWLLCLRASIWDAVLITGVYYLIDTPNRKTRYMLSSILLIFVAIFIEQRALSEGKWAYSVFMPTVFMVGLSPLVQLPLLAIAAYEMTQWYNKKL